VSCSTHPVATTDPLSSSPLPKPPNFALQLGLFLVSPPCHVFNLVLFYFVPNWSQLRFFCCPPDLCSSPLFGPTSASLFTPIKSPGQAPPESAQDNAQGERSGTGGLRTHRSCDPDRGAQRDGLWRVSGLNLRINAPRMDSPAGVHLSPRRTDDLRITGCRYTILLYIEFREKL
jgi:hypothetical protein